LSIQGFRLQKCLYAANSGKTEGIIGTLKSEKYQFNKPKERLWQMLEMAGPKSILSFNLNKLMRDVVQAGK
jgi:hypothetical protein